MKFFRDLWQGAGYLPGYGDHPGTAFLVMFTLMGVVAGVDRGGIYGAIIGALIMFSVMFPVWVIGCIDRARDYQNRIKRELQ